MIPNNIMSELSKAINPYLNVISTYNATYKIAKSLLKKISNVTKRTYYDIDEIFEVYKKGEILDGDTIETGGVFLKYGQIFKPYTHVYGMFNNARKGPDEVKLENGKLIKYGSIDMNSKTFQLPVQKLPNYENLGCAFLYSEDFETFEHNKNKNEEEIKHKPYDINKKSKPIFIIYDTKNFEKYINCKVFIKAKVIKLPYDLARRLINVLDNDVREICSNYIDITEENVNFICLLLMGEEAKAEVEKKSNLLDLSIPMYVESKLGNVDSFKSDKEITDFIASLLPNLPQNIDKSFPLTIGNVDINIGTAFISTNNINVVYRKPGIIGFYTTTQLYNREVYESNLSHFSSIYNNFCIDYKNNMKKHYGIKGKVSLNFIFDYEKAFIFDKKGILYDDEVLDSIEEDNYRTVDWLMNK